MRMIFGPFEPDKPEFLQQGLEAADNVFPGPDGYRPIPSFGVMTDALASTFQGGASFAASDGTVQLIAGTATDLYKYSSTLAWSSMLGSLTASRWYFTQFNNHAIATNGDVPVDVDIQAGTAAALSGSPPDADICATVRDFVVLAKNNTVTWSGFEDRAQWTAGTNQSGSQDMLSGGPITGIAGGEYGLIFQRFRIVRMTYVGVPVIWQFDPISANVGSVSPNSVAQAGRLTFFLSHRGFTLTDGNDVKPIGAERVDRTFLKTYTKSDIDASMYAAIDPLNHCVKWIMPGRAWIYNWQLDQWSTEIWDIRAAFTGFTAGKTLEELDAISSSIDTLGISLDDPRFMGGVPLLFAVNASDEIGTMNGENLKASFELPNMELVQGRETRISQIRPLSDATDGLTVTLTRRKRLGDAGTTESFTTMEDSGDIDCRVATRFVRPVVTIEAGTIWSYFQGLDVPLISGGGRR